MTALLPAIVAIVGALIYGFSSNAKFAELGRLLFFVGLFWLVSAFAGRSMRLF